VLLQIQRDREDCYKDMSSLINIKKKRLLSAQSKIELIKTSLVAIFDKLNYEQLRSEIVEKRLICQADIETLSKNSIEFEKIIEQQRSQDEIR
jgi:hypothetical protein